jgi:putative NADH-flavin reductase
MRVPRQGAQRFGEHLRRHATHRHLKLGKPARSGPAVAGAATDPASVAAIAANHDAVISAVYRADIEPETFFVAAASALLTGAAKAGVPRLVAVSLGTVLPGTPDLPTEHRPFTDARQAELHAFQQTDTDLD